jgi:hypothetical protein
MYVYAIQRDKVFVKAEILKSTLVKTEVYHYVKILSIISRTDTAI